VSDAEDAARYRWLRNESVLHKDYPIVVAQQRHMLGVRYVGPLFAATLDACIDEAMNCRNIVENATQAVDSTGTR
jgi:hypothetical protein